MAHKLSKNFREAQRAERETLRFRKRTPQADFSNKKRACGRLATGAQTVKKPIREVWRAKALQM